MVVYQGLGRAGSQASIKMLVEDLVELADMLLQAVVVPAANLSERREGQETAAATWARP